MNNKEAMKLALEVMQAAIKSGDWKVDGACDPDMALRSLEEALAGKQEQMGEPWGHGGRPMTLRECMEAEEPKQGHSFTYDQMKEQVEGLQRDYDLLLAEYNLLKQEQRSDSEHTGEPVAWVVYSSSENDIVWADKGKRLKQNTPFYTTSQPAERKRTWVGLTDEEVEEIWGEDLCVMYSGNIEATKAIQAKLKEKNT